MKKVVVEMTLEQAEANCKALDLLTRICMGQINIIEELFRYEGVKARDSSSPSGGRNLTQEELKEVGSLCASMKGVLGFERGASFSIGSQAVNSDAHRAYEVLCVLREALAKDRTPNGSSVWHYGLTVRYTKDPAPVASIVGTDSV